MSEWGPFEEKESKWLIFSMGNPNEGHGLALPRAIDDFHSKNIVYQLEFATGQRYMAHIPYTTDRAGDIAKDWSPLYIPWNEFLEKTIQFIKFHLDLIRERGDNISKVIVLNSHGGNDDLVKRKLQQEIQKELGLTKFIATSTFMSKKKKGSRDFESIGRHRQQNDHRKKEMVRV